MGKKDLLFSILLGLLIGVLAMPVLKAIKSDLYEKIHLMIIPLFLIAAPLGMLIANFIGRKVSIIWQVAKFGVIGVLNTLVDWGVLAFLIFLFRKYFSIESTDLFFAGLTFYSIHKAVSFVIANINSYYWNKYWTFASRVVQKTKAQFLQFFVVSVVGFGINVGIASYVFKSISPIAGLNFDQWGIIGAAVGSIAGLVWNFAGYKFIVFKEND